MKEETKQWLEQAERDLKTAKHSLNSKDYYAASFWCQQSIEKALKSICIEKTGSFPKIHDLISLAKLNNAPEEILSLCSKLNPAYTATRYPDIPGGYTKKEAQEVIKYCIEVLKWIKQSLN